MIRFPGGPGGRSCVVACCGLFLKSIPSAITREMARTVSATVPKGVLGIDGVHMLVMGKDIHGKQSLCTRI